MPPRTKSALPITSPTPDSASAVNEESHGYHLVTIACGELRDDGDGGIVEAPKVLKEVEALRAQIARLLRKKADVRAVIAYVGRYEFEVSANALQADLFSGRTVLEMIQPLLRSAVRLIEGNAKSTTSKTASELGISPEVLKIESTLAEILKLGLAATMRNAGSGESSEIPAVSRDALSAIAREPFVRERIDGVVTGLGLESDGIRIEINRGARHAIPGMTLDSALPFLRRATQVSGYVSQVGGRTILEEPRFEERPETGVLNL